MAQKGEDITTRYKVDISDLKKGISEANRQIKMSNSMFNKAAAGMDDWSKSSSGIEAKLKQLKSVLEQQTSKMKNYQKQLEITKNQEKQSSQNVQKLKQALEQTKKEFGENSNEVKEYSRQLTAAEKEELSLKKQVANLTVTLNNQEATVGKAKKEIGNLSDKLTDVQKAERIAAINGKSVDEVLNDMSKSSKKATDGFTIMKGAVSGLIYSGINKVGGMITDSIDDAMKRIDTMNQFERTMTTMTGSNKKAKQSLQDITNVVTGTAYGLNIAAKSAQKFVTSGMDLDKSTRQVELWADAVSFYGDGTNDTFESVTDAIAKMVAQGKVQGDQLDRLTDAGIPAVQLFADATGRSFADVRQALSDGDITTTQFLDTLESAMHNGTKSFASIKGAAKEAGSSWTGTFDNMGAAITRGVTSFITETERLLEENNLPTMQETVKTFGKTVENGLKSAATELPKVMKFGQETYKIVKKLSPVILSVGSAWLSWQVAGKINKTSKAIKTSATYIALTKNVTKQATIATNAHTMATNAGTVATKSFNAAWKANPLGVVLTTVGLLAPLVMKFANYVKESTKETDKNVIATNKLAESQKKLNKELQENASTRKENTAEAENEAGTAEILYRKLDELSKVEDKTNAQKQRMSQLVSELNSIMPDLNLQYDAEKDKLNMSTEAIRENINAQKDLILAKAAQENLTSTAKDIVKKEKEQADAVKQHEKNTKALETAKKKLAEFQKKYGTDVLQYTSEEALEYATLNEEVKKHTKNVEKSSKTVKTAKSDLQKLNDEFNNTSEYAEKKLDQADVAKKLATLKDIAKEAGVEIPKAIIEGMDDGKYAVPASVDELNKLISFDEALKKAKLDGKDIPRFISENVISGKTSIEDAVKQANDILNFNKALKKAKDSGVAIPKTLAEEVKNGQTSVEDATDKLNECVDFNKALKKAKDSGVAIPKDLAKSIKDGKSSVQEATQLLEDSTEFNKLVKEADLKGTEMAEALSKSIKKGKIKPADAIEEINLITQGKYVDLVTEAKKRGLEIPTKIEEGMNSGKTKPSEAMQRINALINYQDALEKANLSGASIPEYYSKAIANGSIKVKDASTAMNNLISVQEALARTGQEGIQIPNTLAQKIVEGKVTVDDAISQMNNWAKFQAMLDSAGLTGTQIPEKMQKAILSGKTKPAEAIKELGGEVETEAKKIPSKMEVEGKKGGEQFADAISKQKSSAKKAGEDLVDGTADGVKNKKKQSSVFSAVASFGDSILNTLRSSLKEHSPSRASNEMGQYLLEGLGLGIDKKEDTILNQVRNFGRSVLGSLEEELSQDINADILKGNLSNTLGVARKTAKNLKTASSALNTNISPAPVVNNYYFNQTNNSPKALSRKEIYRETQRLFELKGGK